MTSRHLQLIWVAALAILGGGCYSTPMSAKGTGGAPGPGTGGMPGLGGTIGSGGTTVLGGATGTGGAEGTGGRIGSGGRSGTGGASGTGGDVGTGGATATGGRTGPGGAIASGGASGTGATAGAGGTTGTVRPCDLYQSGYTPCVAAHSTVRALYASYNGPLYQVRKADNATQDIPVDGPGGFVDISVQDSFCSGTTCTISILYDQSPMKNDLTKSPKAMWLPNGGNEANATDGKITVGGHTAYGIYVNNPTANVAYRNNHAKGLATGDEPEAMYLVLDGKRYSQWCCFDYGNVGTSGTDEGSGTIEALNWGANTSFQMGGEGDGPWIAADLENGIYECDTPSAVCTTNTPITDWTYVTGMLKGPSGNAFGLKAGNAQSGLLETKWAGKRPPGYSPMNKQGAIVLGTGGDGSNYGVGIFYEGAITSGNPADATDDAVQANIVATGYGR